VARRKHHHLAEQQTPQEKEGLAFRIARRLDRIFMPVVGGAQLGTGDEPEFRNRAEWTCPACSQPLSRHRFDDSQRGRMYCPPAAASPTGQ
jgi:hypothetical protein